MSGHTHRRFESFAYRVVHQILDREFRDRLSVALIRSSPSLVWNLVALGALVSALALDSGYKPQEGSIKEALLIAWAVPGAIWNGLSAMAHSARAGHYGRGLLLFAIWPLSYPYNWRQVFLQWRRTGGEDAA